MKKYFRIALIIVLAAGISVGAKAKNLAEESVKKVNMILDIDTGIDDAMALAYALGCGDVNLLGVVGSYGKCIAQYRNREFFESFEVAGAGTGAGVCRCRMCPWSKHRLPS